MSVPIADMLDTASANGPAWWAVENQPTYALPPNQDFPIVQVAEGRGLRPEDSWCSRRVPPPPQGVAHRPEYYRRPAVIERPGAHFQAGPGPLRVYTLQGPAETACRSHERPGPVAPIVSTSRVR